MLSTSQEKIHSPHDGQIHVNSAANNKNSTRLGFLSQFQLKKEIIPACSQNVSLNLSIPFAFELGDT